MNGSPGSGDAPFAGGFPPSEWIQNAEDELSVAERLARSHENAFHGAVAFHCQQAVDKLMKAALVSKGVAPPKVHDLPELLRRLTDAGVGWTWPLTELRKVTVGAVHSRYPGYAISAEDAADILRITREVWGSLRPLM